MEYYQKFKLFINMNDLVQKRKRHLQTEKWMDSKLQLAYQRCPKEVLRFIWTERQVKRKLADNLYSSSIMDYPEKCSENLDIADRFYKYMSTSMDLCSDLPRS